MTSYYKSFISGTLSPDEWEAAYLYMAFVLRKVSTKPLEYHVYVLIILRLPHFSAGLLKKYNLHVFWRLILQRGQQDRTQASGRRDRGLMHISKEDIMSVSSD